MKNKATSNVVDSEDNNETTNLNIRTMPDPEDIYSTTLGAADVSTSSVHVPNIRDRDGKIITPDQYDKKLEDGSIVMINVYLKLYVYLNFIFSY